MPTPSHDVSKSPLLGLVLAGGRGRRLGGRDKGELDYHGVPQARWAFDLLTGLCQRAFVSIRAEQRIAEVYAGLPLIFDATPVEGPAAGLLAAFRRVPAAAWLVLAVDLPLVDAAMLRRLCAARDPALLATAYRHADGTLEPLCAIFEPAARAVLEAQPVDRVSLRRLLEEGPSRILDPENDAALLSANTSADDAAIRARLGEIRRAP